MVILLINPQQPILIIERTVHGITLNIYSNQIKFNDTNTYYHNNIHPKNGKLSHAAIRLVVRLVRAWFLKIVFVWVHICVSVCVCVCMHVCVHVCVYMP